MAPGKDKHQDHSGGQRPGSVPSTLQASGVQCPHKALGDPLSRWVNRGFISPRRTLREIRIPRNPPFTETYYLPGALVICKLNQILKARFDTITYMCYKIKDRTRPGVLNLGFMGPLKIEFKGSKNLEERKIHLYFHWPLCEYFFLQWCGHKS